MSQKRELKEAKMKPLEAGSSIRIGVLASDLVAGSYQKKLQIQGLEAVLPDKPTMEHIIMPAIEALNKNDIEGARNLSRIAIQTLLIRGVNLVILGLDEFQELLPRDDPLLKRCLDPMDSLARSTVKWAHSDAKMDGNLTGFSKVRKRTASIAIIDNLIGPRRDEMMSNCKSSRYNDISKFLTFNIEIFRQALAFLNSFAISVYFSCRRLLWLVFGKCK